MPVLLSKLQIESLVKFWTDHFNEGIKFYRVTSEEQRDAVESFKYSLTAQIEDFLAKEPGYFPDELLSVDYAPHHQSLLVKAIDAAFEAINKPIRDYGLLLPFKTTTVVRDGLNGIYISENDQTRPLPLDPIQNPFSEAQQSRIPEPSTDELRLGHIKRAIQQAQDQKAEERRQLTDKLLKGMQQPSGDISCATHPTPFWTSIPRATKEALSGMKQFVELALNASADYIANPEFANLFTGAMAAHLIAKGTETFIAGFIGAQDPVLPLNRF